MKVLQFVNDAGAHYYDMVLTEDPGDQAKQVSRKIHDVMSSEVTVSIGVEDVPEDGLAEVLWEHVQNQRAINGHRASEGVGVIEDIAVDPTTVGGEA